MVAPGGPRGPQCLFLLLPHLPQVVCPRLSEKGRKGAKEYGWQPQAPQPLPAGTSCEPCPSLLAQGPTAGRSSPVGQVGDTEGGCFGCAANCQELGS